MCLFQEKLSSEILSQNLDLVLRILPEEALGQQQYLPEDTYRGTLTRLDNQTSSNDVALGSDERNQNTILSVSSFRGVALDMLKGSACLPNLISW